MIIIRQLFTKYATKRCGMIVNEEHLNQRSNDVELTNHRSQYDFQQSTKPILNSWL